MELEDMHDSDSCGRKLVWFRLPLPALCIFVLYNCMLSLYILTPEILSYIPGMKANENKQQSAGNSGAVSVKSKSKGLLDGKKARAVAPGEVLSGQKGRAAKLSKKPRGL